MGFQAAFPSALTMYQQLIILVRIVLATVCGSVIGLERSRRLKGAGIRTHSVVAAAACLLMIISKYGFTDLVVNGVEFAGTKGADPSRIASQIVSGVSFLGVGIIYRDVRYATKGLTTAAGIWAVAAIGMAIGSGMYVAGIFTTAFILGLQILMHHHMIGADLYNDMKIEITMKDSPELRKEIYKQLDLWDSVIMEAGISQAGDGYVKNSFTLKSKGKMTHKEVYDYMANHPDIRDFKIYGEF